MPVEFDWQRQDPSDFEPPDPGPFPCEDEDYEQPCPYCYCCVCRCDEIYNWRLASEITERRELMSERRDAMRQLLGYFARWFRRTPRHPTVLLSPEQLASMRLAAQQEGMTARQLRMALAEIDALREKLANR